MVSRGDAVDSETKKRMVSNLSVRLRTDRRCWGACAVSLPLWKARSRMAHPVQIDRRVAKASSTRVVWYVPDMSVAEVRACPPCRKWKTGRVQGTECIAVRAGP